MEPSASALTESAPPLPGAREAARGATRALLLTGGLALVLLIALAWANSLDASFQFDDWNVIVQDARVHDLAAWWHSLPAMRALLKLSYAINGSFGAGPRGFRLLNLAAHTSNALLLFGLLYRRARRLGVDGNTLPGQSTTARQAALLAFTGAALFALEPVQTEAVTYVCGRSSSLAALPCLLAMLCWDHALERPARANGTGQHVPNSGRLFRPGTLHAFGIAAYAMAMTVKETAAVLPLALLLWRWPPSPEGRWRTTERLALVGYGSVAAAALVAALASPIYRHLLATSVHTRPITANLADQVQAWAYLALDLVRGSALNADPPAAAVAPAHGLGAALWGVLWAALLLTAYRQRRRAPALLFALLWYLLWLAPTNSLLPRLDLANDRQLYLALIGPAWLAAVGLGRLHARHRLAGWAAIAVALLALGGATALRNRVYRTEVSFWQDALSRAPDNARAANNLGIAYAVECRDAAAARAFERAIALQPAGYRARFNLQLLRAHRLTRAGAGRCPLVLR